MYKLLTKKQVGFVTTIMYLLFGYCLMMKKASEFVDATLPVGAQYGIMFIMNTITTIATIFISYGMINVLVKFVIDMNYNNFVPLYNILIIISLLKVLCNTLMEIAQLDGKIIIETIIIIVSDFILYKFFRYEKINKNRALLLYLIVCLVEVAINIWS